MSSHEGESARDASTTAQDVGLRTDIEEPVAATTSDSDNDPTQAPTEWNTKKIISGSGRPELRHSAGPISDHSTAASEELLLSQLLAYPFPARTAPTDRLAKSTPLNTAESSSSWEEMSRSVSPGNSPEVSLGGSGVPIVPQIPPEPSSVETHPTQFSRENNPFDSNYALSVGDLLSDLSLIENEVLPNEDFITQWQSATRPGQNATVELTIQTVFHVCIKSFDTMLPNWHKSLEDKDAIKHNLDRDHVLLRDWGSSYAVMDGQLDQLPKEAGNVTETILSFLTEVSTILNTRIPRLSGQVLSVGKSMRAQEGVIRSIALSEASLSRIKDRDRDSAHEDVDSEEDSWSLCAEELHDYVELLHELHPSIEAWVTLREQSPEPSSQDVFQYSATRFHSDIVRSKFREVPEALADVLGDLNFKRYVRLHNARIEQSAKFESASEVEILPEKSVFFHDSGIGSSLPATESRASTHAASQAPSHASSAAFTIAGPSRSKLPRLPKAAKLRPFICDYCGATVHYRTRKEYQRHLIQDLQPYSCVELHCPNNGEVFPTRQHWTQHLQVSHGCTANSPAQRCHLCGEMTDSGLVAICRHFAEHLEDIAMAASPMDINSDDDSDADSMKSHGHLVDGDDKLRTIVEDDELSEAGGESTKLDSKAHAKRYQFEDAPYCAICNAPAYPECPCGSERLQIAVKQAEQRAIDWAINHSRGHILKAFESLTSIRKQAHSQYLASLPNYDIYMRYSGRPPISPVYVTTLQAQIQEAHAELKRGIDADWRASVLRYPAVLDYFYSLIDLRLPSDDAPEMTYIDKFPLVPVDKFVVKTPHISGGTNTGVSTVPASDLNSFTDPTSSIMSSMPPPPPSGMPTDNGKSMVWFCSTCDDGPIGDWQVSCPTCSHAKCSQCTREESK